MSCPECNSWEKASGKKKMFLESFANSDDNSTGSVQGLSASLLRNIVG